METTGVKPSIISCLLLLCNTETMRKRESVCVCAQVRPNEMIMPHGLQEASFKQAHHTLHMDMLYIPFINE